MTQLAVLIATKNRPESLKNALHSIIRQTTQPDTIFVVSDCDSEHEKATDRIIHEIALTFPQIRLIENQRTKNLSGAINTGLQTLIEDNYIPESTYCALLDDDDEWEPEYLSLCLEKAESENRDVVISGLIRHEKQDVDGVRLSIPDALSVGDFFVGNPHVQGSNLFVRFSTLLAAGGFDENLESTTDRDVCIRILDLSSCKVGYIQKHLVHHWALPNTNRLSEPQSPRKIQGLTEFYNKYAPRMNSQEQDAFRHRALKLFGCEIHSVGMPDGAKSIPLDRPRCYQTESTVPLVVGFIATRMTSTESLLNDLHAFFGDSSGIRRVVICDNTPSTEVLKQLLGREQYRSLNCTLISRKTIDEECDAGVFGSYLQDKEQRKGISSGRTVLHHHLYKEAKKIPGSVVWVLDDDIRLEYLTNEHTIVKLSYQDVQDTIVRLKSQGISIAVGKITGDAPLPVHSTLRVQLLDIFSELKRREQVLVSESSGQKNTQIKHIHQTDNLSGKFPDYYYDYSGEHTAHLELPFRESLMEIPTIDDLIQKIPEIGFGKNISRPVITQPCSSCSKVSVSSPSIIPRGGNTIVLNLECLREFPNLSPRIGQLNARRGDTFWCILNNRIKATRVGLFPLAVRQERTSETTRAHDFSTLLADFYGSAFIRAMDQYYERKIQETGSVPRRLRLSIDNNGREMISSLFGSHLNRRLSHFVMNAYRIRGLIGSIENTLESEVFCDVQRIYEVHSFLNSLKQLYSPENIWKTYHEGKCWNRTDLDLFLGHFKEYVKTYHHNLSQEICPEHIRYAKQVTERILRKRYRDISIPLRNIGYGHEGAVFTDGKNVYKYFYAGLANFQEARLEILRKKVLNSSSLPHLSSLTDIIEENGELIFVMSYEGDKEYSGGHLQDILAILNECKESGIAFTNFHPKNLIVNGDTLKLVDIGDSIVPYNEKEFLQMCRRAYLTCRWYFRKDISELMSTALFDPDLPELCGFNYFFEATKKKTKNDLVNEKIVQLVAESRPTRIFDYGCGRGSIAERLADMGYRVFAYDPDLSVLRKNSTNPIKAHYVDPNELAHLILCGEKFDTVVCSLVLCTISDNTEVKEVMGNIRKLVSDDGEVIVALCNPFSSFVPESETHIKLDLPEDTKYQKQFCYQKRMKETGKIRYECHRPFSWYKHLFHQHAFEISGIEEVKTLDIQNLCPSSDFIILKLKPLNIPENHSVSLLIRAGAMEWETIDLQIRHIVSQLEGPQTFLEKIVVTDNYTGPFARQYSQANLMDFKRKLDRLVAEGIIDMVVTAPEDPSIIEDTNIRWFNVSSANPRSRNGQPTFMALFGFEQCRGDYILHMDSDCIIARMDRDHDYLGDMVSIFQSDPNALTVSFNIAKSDDEPYTRDSQGKKWRTEVRCGLISRARILSSLPLPNDADESGALQLAWHRALDTKLVQSEWQSYRGGDRRTFFIHVPNTTKTNGNFWFTVLGSAEQKKIPEIQNNSVDLIGTMNDWVGSLSNECVFIIRGKDVPISKLRRCMDSVDRQTDSSFGLVFIDAGSLNPVPEYIKEVLLPTWGERARAFLNFSPLTSLENNVIAIRDICSNPDSVIITLDMDDALIGTDVIECLREKYRQGADLTVGSMIRTDKSCDYPAIFEDVRNARGGNVWQHLRTFRKYLFDAIPESYFKIDTGWISFAEDWAFMIPMVEMARHPLYVNKILYFYEPTGNKDPATRLRREDMIAKIVEKNPLNRDFCILRGGME
ncbi:glycosyltransferase [Methanofollis ethanolicus]|uniref:glycosyltransferase n=1 Tax=Methanofollis ethanolicus TaxID=488124 RepID=UPI0009F990AD|nr:glycosyltransferase [Methanofollis ethanolicus]